MKEKISKVELLREDVENFYINPQVEEEENRIYIPCGVGKTDLGFFIHGIKKTEVPGSSENIIFALIYNYLIRYTTIEKCDIPACIEMFEENQELDYRSIFRLTMILLCMIKNNYMQHYVLDIDYLDGDEKLLIASYLINYYRKIFSRISGINSRDITIRPSRNGHPVSLIKHKGIFVVDNHEFLSNAREQWFGARIKYHLSEENREDLEGLLAEISPYKKFREGQYESICSMANSSDHSVCIMPTGSGKSLVYYMLSILQPLPIYVIAPTDILIDDQIRNLVEIHRIDDVAHLLLDNGRRFDRYYPQNKINYLTPTTFQNRDLLAAFRNINEGKRIIGLRTPKVAVGSLAAYVVLDEIHCISSWGHDFRPEYLMLSKYLNKYFGNVLLRGFTATANYTVVEDIQKQIRISEEAFFSPIAFEKYNISYNYIRCSSTEKMNERLQRITDYVSRTGARAIVFTKNDRVSERLAEVVGYEADVFLSDNRSAYFSFAKEKTNILITSQELGVGINFPNVRYVIHYGLPLSKSEYIQEIGRAGRSNEHVESYVLFLEETEGNIPAQLLRRNTKVGDMPSLISDLKGDYADIYQMLTNHCPTKEVMIQNVMDVYSRLDYHNQSLYVRDFLQGEMTDIKRLLYFLYSVGYVNDWYSYSYDVESGKTSLMIDICATNTLAYLKDSGIMLNRMKEKTVQMYEFMGSDNRESIAKTQIAKSPEEIIRIYIEWYYSKFLYHQNEQFLDLFDFIIENMKSSSDDVTDQIKDYFQLPFAQIRNDEIFFNSLSTQEVIDKVVNGIGRDTMANVERIISNRYTYKLDLILFFGQYIKNGRLDDARLKRILDNIPQEDIKFLNNAFQEAYIQGDIYSRIEMLNYLESAEYAWLDSREIFIETVYRKTVRDLVFYGLEAQKCNRIIGGKQV